MEIKQLAGRVGERILHIPSRQTTGIHLSDQGIEHLTVAVQEAHQRRAERLRNLTMGRVHDLKREWAVSMRALVEKAHAIGYLSAAQRAHFYRAFSANGWRTREPLSDVLPAERSELPASIAKAVLARGLSPDELARMARFATDPDNTLFRSPQPRLHAV